MPPITLIEDQLYEDVGNSEDIQRQQDNINRVEKSPDNVQANTEAKWIYNKKSIACIFIIGILILLVITLTTLYLYKPAITPARYTKIMVALGNTSTGPTNSVEIIDLASTEFTCNKFPSYPFETLRARGELGFHEILLICGGYDPNRNECNTFEHGEWRPFASMTEARHDFAIMKSPFGNDTIFFLTGGKNEQHSTEVLKKGGFKKAPVQVPIDIAYHCMILLNRTNIIVIGGMQDSSYSAKTHILSTENIHWSNGPRLGVPRVLHSCSKIAKNSIETEKSVIVAGGWTVSDGDTSTVEILDVGSNKWRKGPDLPFGICCSSMVEHPSGGVALIGGRRDGSTNLDTIFHLPHAGEDAKWKELPQKLKIGRTLHTAFLIPDAVADSCQV